ncbi:hypothetical protein F5880DRAFT_1504087 [Lentinula raphanica]|nr:hypothetical protein F5880DRAFT_1504087 [Lentinula raphanica]
MPFAAFPWNQIDTAMRFLRQHVDFGFVYAAGAKAMAQRSLERQDWEKVAVEGLTVILRQQAAVSGEGSAGEPARHLLVELFLQPSFNELTETKGRDLIHQVWILCYRSESVTQYLVKTDCRRGTVSLVIRFRHLGEEPCIGKVRNSVSGQFSSPQKRFVDSDEDISTRDSIIQETDHLTSPENS